MLRPPVRDKPGKPTVPCKFCDKPTTMTGTELCGACHEVSSRLKQFLRSFKARQYVLQQLDEAWEEVNRARANGASAMTEYR